jgi:hypothetical protein
LIESRDVNAIERFEGVDPILQIEVMLLLSPKDQSE